MQRAVKALGMPVVRLLGVQSEAACSTGLLQDCRCLSTSSPDTPTYAQPSSSNASGVIYADPKYVAVLPKSKERAMQLLRRYNVSRPGLKGQFVLAKVIKTTDSEVLVDPGYYGLSVLDRKSLGWARTYTTEGNPINQSDTAMRPGDYILVRVTDFFTPYGDMQLDSMRMSPEVRRKQIWNELQSRMRSGQPVYGRILNSCPGGYAVGVAGYVALLPVGQGSKDSISKIGSLQEFYIHKMNRGPPHRVELSNYYSQHSKGRSLWSNVGSRPG
eukprot:jgi/Chrzof1/9725/Cz04g13160.t1